MDTSRVVHRDHGRGTVIDVIPAAQQKGRHPTTKVKVRFDRDGRVRVIKSTAVTTIR